jgi:hypothetical protein
MDEGAMEVRKCGREQQIFAKNLLAELSIDDMARLKEQYEEKEVHIEDV